MSLSFFGLRDSPPPEEKRPAPQDVKPVHPEFVLDLSPNAERKLGDNYVLLRHCSEAKEKKSEAKPPNGFLLFDADGTLLHLSSEKKKETIVIKEKELSALFTKAKTNGIKIGIVTARYFVDIQGDVEYPISIYSLIERLGHQWFSFIIFTNKSPKYPVPQYLQQEYLSPHQHEKLVLVDDDPIKRQECAEYGYPVIEAGAHGRHIAKIDIWMTHCLNGTRLPRSYYEIVENKSLRSLAATPPPTQVIDTLEYRPPLYDPSFFGTPAFDLDGDNPIYTLGHMKEVKCIIL